MEAAQRFLTWPVYEVAAPSNGNRSRCYSSTFGDSRPRAAPPIDVATTPPEEEGNHMDPNDLMGLANTGSSLLGTVLGNGLSLASSGISLAISIINLVIAAL